MLDVEEAIFVLLSTDAGVTGMIGQRIYAPVLPQTAIYPAFSFRCEEEETITALDGSLGLCKSLIRVFCASKASAADARALARLVKLALVDYSGTVDDGQSPPDTLVIQNIEAVGRFSGFDDRTQTRQVIRDFLVTHEEPIRTT